MNKTKPLHIPNLLTEEEKVERVKDNLFDLSERSPLAGANYLKAVGRFIEKSEVKQEVNIAPDDCFRLAAAVIERIRVFDLGRGSGGDGCIEGEGRVLPEPVCVDTEPEHREKG